MNTRRFLLILALACPVHTPAMAAEPRPPARPPAAYSADPFRVPVGAIVPFALSPGQVAALAPDWLPADGRKVEDPRSPLNGQSLPNLVGRFLLGLEPTADATADAATSGGPAATGPGDRGRTGDMTVRNCGEFDSEAKIKFGEGQDSAVWDSEVNEKSCQHSHVVPYRGVIYLVRVR